MLELGMTTQTATLLPAGYTMNWMKTGLRVSYNWTASDGTPIKGAVILKRAEANAEAAARFAARHISDVEFQIAQYAA